MQVSTDGLGEARRALQQGNRPLAGELLTRFLETRPDHPVALSMLGSLAIEGGRLAEAEALFRRGLAAHPDHGPSLHNLGLCLNLAGRSREAAAALRRALALGPEAMDTWLELAKAEERGQGPATAVAVLYDALSYCPEAPPLLHRLAHCLHHQGRLTEAVTHYRHLLHLLPLSAQTADAWLDLAQALQLLLRLQQAEALLRQVLARVPDQPRALLNLASLLYLTRRYHEAESHLERVLALSPDDARAHQNLGMVRMGQGRNEAALAAFRQALALRPDHAVARSNYLLAALYSDRLDAADILAEARRFGAALPAAVARHDNPPDPDRKLRIGYVSGDFRRHVVGLFLLPVFAYHDRSRYHIHCYSLVDAPDPFTTFFQTHADGWTDARPLSDAALAERIRRDGIDILVDLSGHSSDNRLPAFAHRPAPVQVSWLGYPGTIGLPAIPYRLTDAVLDPPGEEALSVETPIRLSRGWFCYAPPADWGGNVPVNGLPAAGKGHVTFGAFNNFSKSSPSCLDLWARVLAAVPGSRLVARAKPFDDPAERERFQAAFRERGIDPERIDALPYLPDPVAHLAVYQEVDIHLDSLPYAGGTTSCDALWMGVPVITLRGDRPSARLGASVLTSLGLGEWIAESPDDYVRLAASRAADLAALEALRAGLRQRFQASPLHDAEGFTRDLESRLRELWQRWAEEHRRQALPFSY